MGEDATKSSFSSSSLSSSLRNESNAGTLTAADTPSSVEVPVQKVKPLAVPAVEEGSSLMRKATENNKYWSQVVKINGVNKVRLAHLQDMVASMTTNSNDEDSVMLFGRRVWKRVAAEFLV